LSMTTSRRKSAVEIVGLAIAMALATSATIGKAQSAANSPAPYASIASKCVDYAGPGREAAYDLTSPTVSIGLLVPLQGPRKADGEAIVAAARMAVADASRNPFPGRRKLALAIGDESGPSWAGTTSSLIQLVLDKQAVAVVTSTNGATAHLSEQVGNRIGVPVLTLASDKTTTQIDLPWIFRIGPTDEQEARTIADAIYHRRGFHRVLLVTENDHNGRGGAREFLNAARELGAPPPAPLVLDAARPDVDLFMRTIGEQSPEAVAVWTRSPTAKALIQAMQAAGKTTPFYLSLEAAQDSFGSGSAGDGDSAAQIPGHAAVWTIVSASAAPGKDAFAQRFHQETGVFPSPVAAEAYDAIQLIALAVRGAGPNRARVRDRIASVLDWPGASGRISFDTEGNNRAGVRLVRLP
jgi:branched-chain amino acid transport system substrate-binding protein